MDNYDFQLYLNPEFSTTRQVTKIKPNFAGENGEDSTTILFLPTGKGRIGEGGLRTKGYFKVSLPDKPLITVVTVVFNGEAYIEETILSVINQNYENIEYIIIDGGSSDRTINIIRKYENAIDYWVSEEDKGVFDAMNKGINLATGAWINFMNGGDYFLKKDIISKISLLMVDDCIDVLYGNTLLRYDKDYTRLQKPSPSPNFYFGIPFCHQSAFMRTQIYKSNKFSFEYKIYSDYDLFYRIFKKGFKFMYVDETIASYECNGISSNRSISHYKELYSIARKKSNPFIVISIISIDFVRVSFRKVLPQKILRKVHIFK